MEKFRDLFEKLFCKHDWEKFGDEKLYYEDGEKLPYCSTQLIKCKKCGNVGSIKCENGKVEVIDHSNERLSRFIFVFVLLSVILITFAFITAIILMIVTYFGNL